MFRCTLRASLHFAVLYGTVHYFSTVHTQPLDPLWLMEWSQRFSFSSWNFNFFLIAPPEVASFDKSRRCSWNVFYSPLNATAPTFFVLSLFPLCVSSLPFRRFSRSRCSKDRSKFSSSRAFVAQLSGNFRFTTRFRFSFGGLLAVQKRRDYKRLASPRETTGCLG